MLPSRPDRAMLRAFSASAACLAAVLVGTSVGFAWSTGAGFWAGLAVAVAALATVAAVPGSVPAAYRFWVRLSRAYARVARNGLVRIIHFLVLTPVGRLGGSAGYWQSPSEPGWIQRPGEPRTRAAEGNARRSSPAASEGTGAARAWVVLLLPLIAALRLVGRLDPREPLRVPTTMYTLY